MTDTSPVESIVPRALTITCGVTHLLPAAEQIMQALRASDGFRTDGGCGRVIDLANPIQFMLLYRCVECGRFLCKPCILQHFAETGDHVLSAARQPEAGTLGERP